MDPSSIEQVRRFNRTVTQRLGVLNDEYLDRGRPLGQSRVLWELGGTGADIRTLRSRLDLDSGYVSRLVASLEAAGLVSVGPDRTDRRRRSVRLTRRGRSERALLDRRSNDLAASLLRPLNDQQRERLIAAMTDVERLLTAGLVEIAEALPTHPDAVSAFSTYLRELDERFDGGFEPTRAIPVTADELTPPAGLVLLARLHSEPIGCGALRLHGRGPAEVKRMWVAPTARGLGVGRRVLDELELRARGRRVSALRLETNDALVEALALYRSSGYVEIEAFNDEPHADRWFEKRLSS